MTFSNLVLSGGGIKGYYYIGVIESLYKNGLIKDIKNICGTSAGAFFALLITLKYSYEEIHKTLVNINLKNKVNIYDNFDFSLFFEKFGFDNGDQFNKIIDTFIKKKIKKNKVTFIDLYNYNNIELTISTTNLSKNSIEYFNYKLTPNVEINLAIRMSISIPFLFTPIKYNNNLYVDGGLTNNLPIEYFKDELEKTLVISLTSNKVYNELDSIEKYIYCILKCSFSSIDIEKVLKYKKYILLFDNKYHYLDFSINDIQKNKMIQEGAQKTEIYIKKRLKELKNSIEKSSKDNSDTNKQNE